MSWTILAAILRLILCCQEPSQFVCKMLHSLCTFSVHNSKMTAHRGMNSNSKTSVRRRSRWASSVTRPEIIMTHLSWSHTINRNCAASATLWWVHIAQSAQTATLAMGRNKFVEIGAGWLQPHAIWLPEIDQCKLIVYTVMIQIIFSQWIYYNH